MTEQEQLIELAKERASELVTDFTAYTWSDKNGYMSDDAETKKLVNKVIDILIEEQTMWQNGQSEPVEFWQEVRKQLKSV